VINSYWLGQLIFLSMIDKHIIWVELGCNSSNATCGFNTKTHCSKGEILMNWHVRDEWYSGKENTR
jgi:hypothetical protein